MIIYTYIFLLVIFVFLVLDSYLRTRNLIYTLIMMFSTFMYFISMQIILMIVPFSILFLFLLLICFLINNKILKMLINVNEKYLLKKNVSIIKNEINYNESLEQHSKNLEYETIKYKLIVYGSIEADITSKKISINFLGKNEIGGILIKVIFLKDVNLTNMKSKYNFEIIDNAVIFKNYSKAIYSPMDMYRNNSKAKVKREKLIEMINEILNDIEKVNLEVKNETRN